MLEIGRETHIPTKTVRREVTFINVLPLQVQNNLTLIKSNQNQKRFLEVPHGHFKLNLQELPYTNRKFLEIEVHCRFYRDKVDVADNLLDLNAPLDLNLIDAKPYPK